MWLTDMQFQGMEGGCEVWLFRVIRGPCTYGSVWLACEACFVEKLMFTTKADRVRPQTTYYFCASKQSSDERLTQVTDRPPVGTRPTALLCSSVGEAILETSTTVDRSRCVTQPPITCNLAGKTNPPRMQGAHQRPHPRYRHGGD